MKPVRFFISSLILILQVQLSYAQTVYITKTGIKYHEGTCRYLSRSKIAISLSDANARGYTACSVCKPPNSVKKNTQQVQPTQQRSNTNNTQNQSGQQKTDTTKVQKQNTQPIKTQTKLVQCSAITKAGTRCKRMTSNPNGRCWQHQ